MKRLFWFALGAATGAWAATRSIARHKATVKAPFDTYFDPTTDENSALDATSFASQHGSFARNLPNQATRLAQTFSHYASEKEQELEQKLIDRSHR